MSDQATLELNAQNIRTEIENYSLQHPNDFGVRDGRDRIPMKKLMKLFGIKKKSPAETQNLFRQLVNDHCELEIKEEIGKVLILKPSSELDDTSDVSTSYGDSDDDQPDYGYGEAAPDCYEFRTEKLKSESDDEGNTRPPRFQPPGHSTSSGALSVASAATADSVGIYDNNGATRRTGYRRRGSVTRYSIVGQEQVIAEYKKHEDVINQFRRDSLKIENSIRNLSLNGSSNHSNKEALVESPKKEQSPAKKAKGKTFKPRGMKKLLRTRFSLAF